MLFQPIVENDCTDGLELFPALVDVPRGLSNCVKVPVQNSTNHAVYLRDDTDIGCIPDLQLKIWLKDDTPVQKSYNTVPKPLYREVKEYVQKLLDHGWIQKYMSPYSSPVVCVWKKDMSLHLCVD